MSLVSDALRKARQYATARDIQRHGAAAGPYAPPPRRSRLGLGLVLGAVIALAAATAGAAFVLWWFGRVDRATAGAAATLPGPAGAATPATALATPADAAPPRPRPRPAAAQASEEAAGAAVAVARPTAATPEADRAGQDQPAPAATPPPQPAAETGERVYVLRADLGYAKLQLDFLVYKPGGGFGRVNGQDVIPGSLVDGFTVEEFGPDFVRLRDARGPLVLRTR